MQSPCMSLEYCHSRIAVLIRKRCSQRKGKTDQTIFRCSNHCTIAKNFRSTFTAHMLGTKMINQCNRNHYNYYQWDIHVSHQDNRQKNWITYSRLEIKEVSKWGLFIQPTSIMRTSLLIKFVKYRSFNFISLQKFWRVFRLKKKLNLRAASKLCFQLQFLHRDVSNSTQLGKTIFQNKHLFQKPRFIFTIRIMDLHKKNLKNCRLFKFQYRNFARLK